MKRSTIVLTGMLVALSAGGGCVDRDTSTGGELKVGTVTLAGSAPAGSCLAFTNPQCVGGWCGDYPYDCVGKLTLDSSSHPRCVSLTGELSVGTFEACWGDYFFPGFKLWKQADFEEWVNNQDPLLQPIVQCNIQFDSPGSSSINHFTVPSTAALNVICHGVTSTSVTVNVVP
jgi:hypothetical protein